MSFVRFKGIFQKIVALCCAVTVCAAIISMPTPEVRAVSTSELKDKISDYDDKIDAINDKIDSLEDDKKEANALAEALQEKIDNLEYQKGYIEFYYILLCLCIFRPLRLRL